MSIITLLLIVLVLGILIPMLVPIDPTARTVINIILVVLLIGWLLIAVSGVRL